jgi:hypothetical protein
MGRFSDCGSYSVKSPANANLKTYSEVDHAAWPKSIAGIGWMILNTETKYQASLAAEN